MEFNIVEKTDNTSTCIVVGLFEDRQWPDHTKYLAPEDFCYIDTMLKKRDIQISGHLKQAELIHGCPGDREKNVLIVGLGSADAFSEKTYQKVLEHMFSALNERGIDTASTLLHHLKITGRSAAWNLKQALLMVDNINYRFIEYKTDTQKDSPRLVVLNFKHAGLMSLGVAKSALAEAQILADTVTIARDLGNMPPNDCNPSYLARYSKKMAKGLPKLSAKSYGEKTLKKLGMNCLLAVGAGSEFESQLITLEYKGGKAKDKPVVLVGKGITFDSGGLNIKPFPSMCGMNMDMCGAANVIATLIAVAKLKLPINVVGVVASAENKTGAKAYRPNDIIKSMSGQTVQVLNTDAEGRLVLCDALTYSKKFDPKVVIDMATLTGAIIVALGHYYTGLFANDDALAQALLSAGRESTDELWQMPLNDYYDGLIDSPVADVTNINANKQSVAGSSTAAAYLARFAKDYCWAHLDVAGTAMGTDGSATGRGVPMLVEYLINHSGEKS